MHGGGWRSWHSSALYGAQPDTPSAINIDITQYRKAGVPARKLSVGVGFYGSCWAGGVTGPRQLIGGSSIVADDNVMSFTNIKKLYYSANAYHYDTVAQAPYLSYPTPHGPQGCTWVSYENARSIRAKGAYATARGLGGLFVWTANQAHVLGAAAGHRDPLLKIVRTGFGA